MFNAFQSIASVSSKAGGNTRSRGNSTASTVFSKSDGTGCIKVTFVVPGTRGNNYVACLLKLSATRYRFRLFGSDGTRLNTLTKEDASPPSTVIAQLVDAINSNSTFNKYIHVTFLSESTEAFSSSVDIGDGQRLRGGR